MKMVLFLAVCFATAPALAADWSKPNLKCSKEGTQEISTWSESATTDSGVLNVLCPTKCSNTGSTDFTVYSATSSGTKLAIWLGPVQDGVSCSPNAGNTTCNEVTLDPGTYVFDPDATAASATCVAGSR